MHLEIIGPPTADVGPALDACAVPVPAASLTKGAVLLVVGAVVVGYLLGGPATGTRKVLALGTGQRNLSAAFAVATANFSSDPNVLVEILVVTLLVLVVLMVIAKYLGNRPGGMEPAGPAAGA